MQEPRLQMLEKKQPREEGQLDVLISDVTALGATASTFMFRFRYCIRMPMYNTNFVRDSSSSFIGHDRKGSHEARTQIRLIANRHYNRRNVFAYSLTCFPAL